jgi:hypothetical protein
MADRSRVSRITTAPVHPQSKAPIQATAAPAVALKPVSRVPGPVAQPKQVLPEVKLKSTAASAPAPVAVKEEKGEPLLDTEMHQREAGHHVLYRGDTRSPAQLKGYGGFSAWVPMSVEEARKVVRRGLGENFVIKLPGKANRLEKLFNSPECQSLTLLTLAKQIKLEKAGDTFHVSTDPTEGCGGYASGYIYAMRFKTLFLVDKQRNARTASFQGLSRVDPKLLLDAQSLDAVSTIAVAIDPDEVAFLTTITIGHIYKYKEPKGHVWYKMPA